MPDGRRTAGGPAATARDADGQCRGIGPSFAPASSPGRGRGRGAWPTPPADAPVARPVVREAESIAVRSAITQKATAAVTQDAAERAARGREPATTRDVAPSEPLSAELTRRLDQLRTAVPGGAACR